MDCFAEICQVECLKQLQLSHHLVLGDTEISWSAQFAADLRFVAFCELLNILVPVKIPHCCSLDHRDCVASIFDNSAYDFFSKLFIYSLFFIVLSVFWSSSPSCCCIRVFVHNSATIFSFLFFCHDIKRFISNSKLYIKGEMKINHPFWNSFNLTCFKYRWIPLVKFLRVKFSIILYVAYFYGFLFIFFSLQTYFQTKKRKI